jgi:hypothetical protein
VTTGRKKRKDKKKKQKEKKRKDQETQPLGTNTGQADLK